MASYRHLSRTCVMQTLFENEFLTENSQKKPEPEKILAKILAEFAPKLSETDFAYETLRGVLSHKKKLVKMIEKHAPQWPIEKIARVDRAILEIGVYEILYSDQVPDVVAINEAVEVAKHFGDESSSKFINGVLSSVMKEKDGK